MAKPEFDRQILRWIAKSSADQITSTTSMANVMMPAHGYGLLMAQVQDDLSDLDAAIEEIQPGARILRVEAVETGEDTSQPQPAFIEVLRKTGGVPDAIADENLPGWMFTQWDFMLVYHADRLSRPSLHRLRRDRGMPPAVLISYDSKRMFTTLSQEQLLARYTYIFPTDIVDLKD
jgi:hypothetical protein